MMTTGAVVERPAGVAGGFELASPEARAKKPIKTKTRNDGRMRCTVTGSYISEDETDKAKVTQNEKGENGTRERKKMDGLP